MSPSALEAQLSPIVQRLLLDLAHASIQSGLSNGRPSPVTLEKLPAELRSKRASFVTLLKAGELRGCIGSLEAWRPLAIDITANAFAAAFRDPRFSPLMSRELDELTIHISLLTAPELMAVSSEEDLIDQLQPGIDGLILEDGTRRGTFLPAVWESLADPRAFVQHLKRKAGLPVDYWSDSIRFLRYRADMIG